MDLIAIMKKTCTFNAKAHIGHAHFNAIDQLRSDKQGIPRIDTIGTIDLSEND
jgi:hypothetical protein